jgi:hypothetical protein
MQRRNLYLVICVLVSLAIALPVFAQNGFPLKGTWSGEWGPSKSERHRVLLEFDWDGKTISGTLNPGPNAAKMTNVRLTPPAGGIENAGKGWPVHFEADVRNEAGQMVHVVVDGQLENIGAFKKFITGAWQEGNLKGYFEVTRN